MQTWLVLYNPHKTNRQRICKPKSSHHGINKPLFNNQKSPTKPHNNNRHELLRTWSSCVTSPCLHSSCSTRCSYWSCSCCSWTKTNCTSFGRWASKPTLPMTKWQPRFDSTEYSTFYMYMFLLLISTVFLPPKTPPPHQTPHISNFCFTKIGPSLLLSLFTISSEKRNVSPLPPPPSPNLRQQRLIRLMCFMLLPPTTLTASNWNRNGNFG